MRACRSAAGSFRPSSTRCCCWSRQIRAGRAAGVERDHAVDRLVARRRDQRHRAALAATRHHHPPVVHVVALRQPLHDRAHIVGIVGQRGGFGASAALPAAAAVVAEHDDAGIGERFRQLREHRNAARSASSRSAGTGPPTSTTAGWRSRPATPGGVVSVPARLKPLAWIETSASVGLRAVCARVATLDASSRTTTRPAEGISNRTRRSLSSMITTAVDRRARVLEAELEAAGRHRPARSAERLLADRLDRRLDLGLRRRRRSGISAPTAHGRQPRRQRFVARRTRCWVSRSSWR